jgi:hypothetical protein
MNGHYIHADQLLDRCGQNTFREQRSTVAVNSYNNAIDTHNNGL